MSLAHSRRHFFSAILDTSSSQPVEREDGGRTLHAVSHVCSLISPPPYPGYVSQFGDNSWKKRRCTSNIVSPCMSPSTQSKTHSAKDVNQHQAVTRQLSGTSTVSSINGPIYVTLTPETNGTAYSPCVRYERVCVADYEDYHTNGFQDDDVSDTEESQDLSFMDAPNAADDDLLQQSDHEGFSDELNGHFRVRVRSISVPNRPTRNGGFENCNANGVDSSTNRAHADQSARKKVIVKVNSVTQPGQHVLRKARKFSSISAKYERRRQKMEGIKHKGLDDLQSMLRSLPHGMQEERSVIQRRIQELRETPASDTSDTAKPMTRPATSMALVKLDLPLPQENGQSALRRSTSGSGTTVRCSRKFGASPADIKNALLTWCQQRTANYKNISITNFSSAWADGLAFCALVHRHFPDAFNYSELTPNSRKRNFELAFSTAEERADVWPLLEVDDMLMMGQKPDWKCVFTYVQSLYKALKDVE